MFELVAAIVAVGAIVLLVTRDDESGEPRAESKRGAAVEGSGGSAEQGTEEGADEAAAAPTKAELLASRRVQDHVALTTTAAENTLAVFGLEGRVRVLDEGRVAILFVARSSACDALPADESRIREFLMDAHPSIRKVVVKVAGTGESLSSYVSANCTVPKLPGGRGKTVYRIKGESFVTSETFRIRKRKWAIDYRAEGARLFMLVYRGDEVIAPGIGQRQRGTGSQKYKGRGLYHIEIRGSGHWTVRVREGA